MKIVASADGGAARRRGPAALVAAVLATGALIAGCGSSSGSTPTLNWYSFPEPSGSFAAAAKACSAASGGKYNIALNLLPSDPDGRRTQLVRRLAAKDNGIDIIGMDATGRPSSRPPGGSCPGRGPTQPR